MTENSTIEDLLELAAGLKGQSSFSIDSNDTTIIHSIARQVVKGVALTDRQFFLMQEKLTKYRNQFTSLEYNFDTAVKTLRQPLREIDRSKYIKVVNDFLPPPNQYDRNDQVPSKKTWMCVRFPFSKKLISIIDSVITNRKTYHHDRGSHEHYFQCNETNILNVISEFQDRNFIIDQELLDLYTKLKLIKSNPEEYVPGVFNGKLKNIHPNAEQRINEELPELSNETLIYYLDRKRRFGLEHFDSLPTNNSLAEVIASRSDVEFLCKPSEYQFNSLIEALCYLDRYPLLVVIDDNHAEQQLHDVFNAVRNVVPSEQQSVLMRLPNETNSSFNEYIRENNLNNWVDKSTKIVYINNNKLPKLTVTGEWKPITALTFGSHISRVVDSYINCYCDLIICRDESTSLIRKYSRFYV